MVKALSDTELIYNKMQEYKQDPVGFCTKVLSLKPEYVWRKMVNIMTSVRDNQFTAVRAAHSVSKTFSLGRVAVWFKTCFQPSTVITTAPNDNLVRNQLWREIHAAYAGAKIPLGGKMTSLQWDVKPSKEVLETLSPEVREAFEKNFAIGFSTSPDASAENATKMQGWHNVELLLLLDEVCGLHPIIWKTGMISLITNERCKVVAIGNPTDPECDFARACHSSDPDKNEGNETYISDEGWTVITISAKDTPNYKQNKEVIPGLASRQWVDRLVNQYGEKSDTVRMRILGLFPTHKEGTYYGAKLAKARKEGRVGNYGWVDSAAVYTFMDTGDVWTAVIFAQFLRGRIRIIDDYFDNEGLGLPNLANVLQGKPYVYGGYFVGPELKYGTSGKFQTGKTTLDLAAELKLHLQSIPDHSFDDGIEAGRSVFNQLEINEDGSVTFIKAMSGYGKKKNMALSNDETTIYHDTPAKPHRHMADAFRHLAVQYLYGEIGGENLGWPGATPTRKSYVGDRGVGDLLEVGS
ncbi:hypothetical protein LCGC14_1790310 [marine sediment metagenome]|uniref:Terminase large subunit gp17-like C-terminal domain-containing protein n=1 Tax=marine sediment metagenome TaxID=412755 RepID=A0A0F9HFB9_9ZZZZ|nr:hypothetical protein [Phycisphaerales bacterium]